MGWGEYLVTPPTVLQSCERAVSQLSCVTSSVINVAASCCGVQGLGFTIYGLGVGVEGLGPVYGLGFGAWCLEFGVRGLVFRVHV